MKTVFCSGIKKYYLSILCLVFCFVCVDYAFGTTPASTSPAATDSMQYIACKLNTFVTGSVMQVVLLVAIFSLGAGLMLGKIQTATFIMFVAALGVIFGAGSIIKALTPAAVDTASGMAAISLDTTC